MNGTRFASVSAAVMLGISTAVVPIVNPVQVLPVASAQTYPETVVSGRTTFNVEQNPAGQYILVSPSPNIEGDQASDVPPVYLWPSLDNPDVNVEYPMQLVKKTVGGLDYYAWYVVRQNAYHESGEGDAVCQTMEWTARAVNDHQLWDPPNNGFLNEPRTTDRHFVNTSVQHFGSVWRFPFATGQPLFNYEMTFTFPGELPEPVREFNPLFTGAMDLTMQDGSTLHIPEFNPNPAHPGMPARRGYNVQQLEEQFGVNYFEWDIVKIGPANPGDDYVYKVSTPYIPAGSATVLQFNQSVPGAVANTETFETRVAATGEAFCYTPIEVQQGAEAEMASPTAFSSDTDAIADATYSRTPETPLWAVVREDGTIVVKPGYDIPAQEYAFPVNIHRAGDVQDTTVIAKVMVTPAQFQPTYTGTSVAQGATATTPTPVGADGLSLPRGTSYALDADNTENPLPAWATSIDPTTGVITVAPGFDVAPGIYQVPVTVTYPDGATGTVLAPVTVVNPNNPFYEPIQVVQGGDTPVIAAAPTNGDGSTLPTGTSFAATPETQDWATVNHDGTVSVPAGYDVPVGVYEVPVAVTYPDGTTSTIHLPVQVVNEDDPRYEPTMIEQGQAGTVKAPTDAQDGVLPEGARFALGDNPPAWATSINEATGEIEIAPGVTVPEGFYSIPVVVTIPGGTELTIEAPVAVTSTLKAPVYESITVNQSETGTVQIPRNHDGSALPTGTTFAAAPETQNWVTILPDGSISVIPGNTTPAGSYEVPVVVSYPDGTSETVSALVTVVNPNTPVYEQGSVLPGDSVTSAAPAGVVTEGAEYSIDPATVPAGWTNVTVDPATGVVTATAPGDAAAGVVAIPVTVTYADGSAVVVDFPVMVLPLAGEVDPFYTPVSTQPNVAVDVPVGLPEGQTVPEGTEFGLPEGYTPPAGWQVSVDAETGTVTVTPPADAPAGALIDVPVVATYPDGSTGELTATVTVGVTDAADNDPGYDPATVLPGAEVTVPQSGDSELPEGTEFGLPEGYTAPDGWTVEVDPGTGEVTATSPEGAVPGESITVPVVVSYPDGTTDDAPATIVVGDAGPTEADDNTPGYGAETTKPGTPVDVPQTGDTELPDGTEFTLPEDYTPPAGWEVTVDPTDGTVTVTPPADATPGTVIQVPIVVTYPDGSTDDATATVGVGTPDVLPTDADDNDPGYAPGKTDPGVALDVPQTGDTELPDGTEFTLPEGYTPPEGWEVTVDPTTGTTTVTPSADAQPGDLIQVPVVVTYPDESVDTVVSTVTVTSPDEVPSEADDNNPGYNPGRTNPGTPVDVPQTGDTELPDGTEFTLPEGYTPPEGWEVTVDPTTGTTTVTPPADAQPGDLIQVPVVVTYPDGSTDDATVPVTVAVPDEVPTEADDNKPGYNPGRTNPGIPVDVPQTGDTELPDGTEFTLPEGYTPPEGWEVTVDPTTGTVTVTPPSDAQPGDLIQVPIVVTYPDGSTDDATVPVTVGTPGDVTTQADDNNPAYDPGDTVPGIAVDLPQTGDTDMPDGTEYTLPEDYTPPTGWEVVVDPTTGTVTITPPAAAQPGDSIIVPVLVTYPDDSSEQTPAQVIVTGGDAADFQPVYESVQVIQDGPAVIAGPPAGDQPAGTTYAPADGTQDWASVNPDGTVSVQVGYDVPVGPYDVPVTVNYPDGTSEVVNVPVSVINADDASYLPTVVTQGGTATVAAPLEADGVLLPVGTTFEAGVGTPPWAMVDPLTGEITLTPGFEVPAQAITIPVAAMLPSGELLLIDAPVFVQAAVSNPVYQDATVNQGETALIATPTNPDGTAIVPGSTFASADGVPAWATVNPDGTISVAPGTDVVPGTYTIPVTVTYPDGTTGVAQAKVTVVGLPDDTTTEAEDNNPGYNPGRTNPGTPVDVPQTVDTELPDGTEFILPEGYIPPEGWEVDVDPTTGTVTVTPPADATPGDLIQVPVVVTYPDGSTDDATVPVTVGTPDEVPTEADDHNPGYNPGTTKPGTTVDVEQTVDTELPDGTEFSIPEDYTPPAGWEAEVDLTTGTVTVTPPADAAPGDLILVPVVVTYPDGSSETVVSTVTVGAPDVTPTEADENQPDYQPESTVPGTPVDVTQDADLPEGTEFTLPEGYTPPAGWDVVVDPTTGTVTVTPPADAAPGAVIQVPIVATYPDGSQDNVTATVAVGMDDLYYPGTQVQQGGTATVSTPRGPDGGPLPDDVEFRLGDDAPEWASLNEDGSITVTPGRDVLPGFYTIPVEVTDADGNTIILPAVVQVTPAAPVVDDPSSPPSSSYSQRCAAAGVTVGLPLLFLIPLGLAAQVNMPGLSPMISQIQGQIEQTNANLQRNLGIFDPNAAQFVEQLNAMLNENGQAGQIIGGAALVAAGLLVSSYLHDNCVGGGSSTSSASSLSSGSSSS